MLFFIQSRQLCIIVKAIYTNHNMFLIPVKVFINNYSFQSPIHLFSIQLICKKKCYFQSKISIFSLRVMYLLLFSLISQNFPALMKKVRRKSRYCHFKGCNYTSDFIGVHFYRFPKDEKRLVIKCFTILFLFLLCIRLLISKTDISC